MDGINWNGLSRIQNPFANFAEGMQMGADMRQQRQRNELLAQRQAFEIDQAKRKQTLEDQERARKTNVGAAVAKGDYAAARTAAEGDFDMLSEIGKLDEAQRKAAAERAGVLVAYIDSFQGKSEQEIMAQIQQDAPALMELGYTQEQLANFRPSPGVLAKMRAEALGLKGVLEERGRQRDDARADAQFEETKRSNAAAEAARTRQLGLAADANRRGWASFNERKKAGGFGTPGVGAAGIADDDVEIDP